MEISASSFRNLLRNISKAVAVKESAVDYENILREIFQERDAYHEALVDSEIRSQIGVGNLQNVFGRENEVEQLLSQLLNSDEHVSVIPIVGDCGIGKTSLARRVYDDVAVKKYFEVRAWVEVDGMDFGLHHAAQQILKSAMGMSCSFDDLDELDEMVRDTLRSQKCLIVFDGIEYLGKDSWLHMNKYWFDFVDWGSKVLVTTTSNDVAYLVDDQPFTLKQLSQDSSLFVCRYLAYNSSDRIRDKSRPMAENLASLCQGIPLLLKLLGSLMRCDEKLRNLLSSVDFSDGISVTPFDVSVALLLCVWGLPQHLRQCLAYCALFPIGYAMKKESIIDMWIAHGIVNPSPGRDIGDSYFHQLLCRSFFTDTTRDQYNAVLEFKIPGLIHKIAGDVSRIVFSEKLGLIASISEDACHLSLISPSVLKYKSHDLQTLILSHALYLDSSTDHSLLDFQELRSLDLSCSGIRCLSDDICALKEIRYLNLSHTLIKRLPDSVADLSQLQTLDLSWCYHLKVLPDTMRNLTHMIHLDLYQCMSLSYLPSGIGFLMSLTSMPLFVLGKDHDCARLGELRMLNHLTGRLEIRNLENVKKVSEARDAMLHWKNLHHLGLYWSQNAEDCFKVLELLRPNPRLRVLELTGYMGLQFPNWISSINSLIKISITDCGCKELPSLGQLPLLEELQLKGMINLERIGPEFYGDGSLDVFPSLEKLGLYDMPMLSVWLGEAVSSSSGISFQCMFGSLKNLTIEGCPQLQHLPSLPTLSDLTVWSSNKSILSSLTSFTSLSSLLINDMEMGVSNFQDLSWLDSLKKLILCNIRDKLIVNISHVGTTFTALEHLGILHCQQLTDLCLFYFSSLQKLYIVDCPKLFRIMVREEEDTPLVELVVEDCPEVFSEVCLGKLRSLRKLIIKQCGDHFTIYYAGEYRKLEKLEYLSINGCPRIELELLGLPSLISHIPCIIVGDHKANYKDMQDLMEVPVRAPHESKEELFTHQIRDTKPESGRSATKCFGTLCAERKGSLGFLRVVRRTNKDLKDVLVSTYDVMVLSPDRFSHSPQNIRAIKYKEIKKATRNFSPDMSLGAGGFGTVFKGWIDERSLTAANSGLGIFVAVKKLSSETFQGHNEWLKEKNYLSRLRHPNLVKLIGYCIEEEERILVYEFMPKGSLDNHLFRSRGQWLSWATRIKVAVGVARVLSFLHELEIPVIHRGIKSGDILLDGEYNPKLSDFGLARDGPTGDMTHVTTQVMGTYGYAAPEYMATGHLSTKCDVYGFGVVLLELLSGLPVLDRNRPSGEQNLVDWARSYLATKKKLPKVMDARLKGQYKGRDAYTVAKLASRCLSLDPKERPRMIDVVLALEHLWMEGYDQKASMLGK